MIESLDYLVSLFTGYINRLSGLMVIGSISLLDLVAAVTILAMLIVFLFGRR